MMRSKVSVCSLSPCEAAEKVPAAGPLLVSTRLCEDLLDVWRMEKSAPGSTFQL